MQSPTNETCAPCGSWWRLPLLLAIVLGAIVLFRIGDQRSTSSPPEVDSQLLPAVESDQPVSLIIEFGDKAVTSTHEIAWHEGMTVEDLLIAASVLNRSVSFVRQGSGAMAFLSEIGNVANEGAGGRNWIYSVNGKTGDRSFAVYELEAGDRVLWSFALPE